MIDILIFSVVGLVACGLTLHQYVASLKRKALENARNFQMPNIFGKGTGFASDKDCRKGGLFKWKGIRLGFSAESGKEFRSNHDSHLLMIGPTGSAKTSSFFIPNIVSLKDWAKLNADNCRGNEQSCKIVAF